MRRRRPPSQNVLAEEVTVEFPPASEIASILAAIVAVNIVLSGDNAIVIALASRKLPPRQRRRAILWGAAGALAVRVLLTSMVVWLMSIPGLMAAGGLILGWIAYRLVTGEDARGGRSVPAAAGFWSAMQTIVVADATMGADNVLAVAAAARGNMPMVVVGLALSIPVIVWGSAIVLRFLERWPWLVYLGGGVLAWTAVSLFTQEPFIARMVARSIAVGALLHIGAVAALLAFAWRRNRRVELQSLTGRL